MYNIYHKLKNISSDVKFIFCLLLIVICVFIFFIACGSENTSNDIDIPIPPDKPGVIGKKFEDVGEFEKEKSKNNWVAVLGKDTKEIYDLEQYVEDAKLYLLSNMNPDEALLKIDNPIFKSNIVWDIISRKLLYRKGLSGFKIFNEKFKEDIMKIMENEAKTRYLILKEINEPIKNYQSTEKDKIKFFNIQKDIYSRMGIDSYKQIRNITNDFTRYYIGELNQKFIDKLLNKYKYKINEEIVDQIKKMYSVDEILESECVSETIITINDIEYNVSYFAKYLLYRLTMVYAKSFNILSLTSSTLSEEIDTIIQNFLGLHLKLEEFKTKKYNEKELRRFINMYIESKVADIYIRKEVDNRIPPPIGNEVDKYYEEHEVTVLNYFWRNFGAMAIDMTEEDFKWYTRSVIAEMVLHNERISLEQANFRNYIMEERNYEANKKLLEKDVFKDNMLFDNKKGKNPNDFFK